MNSLAIDTSTNILSIALKWGENYLETTCMIGLKHCETLMPLIKNLLDRASISPKKLDLVICSAGPGSFTGLRIGMATSKGLALGIGCPLVSVSSLDMHVFSLNFFDGLVVPVIDARKKRLYTALYIKGRRITDYLDIEENELFKMVEKYEHILFTGPDACLFKSSVDGRKYFLDPGYNTGKGFYLIKLGIEKYNRVGPDRAEQGPLYVRKSDAEILHRKKENCE
ncbi:MAG: tRNA (adenosine(37)-N6)-threonylcarbamoyltransferase complex dimerization subunit type 1 TsaB [Spirochaetes bacterium]|nr:MAG: tRNA (adenosine(37)-N6)-threonylcarbamoyltransferase complex dimerization subunit type 1 TsaB [Spirochaetota bacterium]